MRAKWKACLYVCNYFRIFSIVINQFQLIVPGGSNKDGEEGAGAEATEQDAGVAARACQRARRAEQPRFRRRPSRAPCRSRGNISFSLILPSYRRQRHQLPGLESKKTLQRI